MLGVDCHPPTTLCHLLELMVINSTTLRRLDGTKVGRFFALR